MDCEQDISLCLGKLERCYTMIQQFQKRVDCYLYEPTTVALFETKAYLKNKIIKLSESNKKLLEFIKSSNDLLPWQYKLVNYHIRETSEFESHFTEYTTQFKKSV